MFECSLPGGRALSALFTDAMLVKTFPFLYDEGLLGALLGGQPIARQMFPLNQSSALLVLGNMQVHALARYHHWGPLTRRHCRRTWASWAGSATGGGSTPSRCAPGQASWQSAGRGATNPSTPCSRRRRS